MKKETVFSSEWFSVEAQYGDDRGKEGVGKPFYKVQIPDGVVILPVTPDNHFVLIHQYRPALGRVTLEIPAGAVNEGESPEDAAAREVYEETGFHCADIKLVGRGILRVDREDACNHYFIATGAIKDTDFEPKEDISTSLLTPDEFRNIVIAGHFDHIAALPLFVMGGWAHEMDFGFSNPMA
ncbi:MAG: NUDIX hydrolase [Rhodospirillales bacterium]|jgi:ADP-ribose pyrophosphatase|nr:NUDIX hydrolase [Rhodospirillales bacterium]